MRDKEEVSCSRPQVFLQFKCGPGGVVVSGNCNAIEYGSAQQLHPIVISVTEGGPASLSCVATDVARGTHYLRQGAEVVGGRSYAMAIQIAVLTVPPLRCLSFHVLSRAPLERPARVRVPISRCAGRPGLAGSSDSVAHVRLILRLSNHASDAAE